MSAGLSLQDVVAIISLLVCTLAFFANIPGAVVAFRQLTQPPPQGAQSLPGAVAAAPRHAHVKTSKLVVSAGAALAGVALVCLLASSAWTRLKAPAAPAATAASKPADPAPAPATPPPAVASASRPADPAPPAPPPASPGWSLPPAPRQVPAPNREAAIASWPVPTAPRPAAPDPRLLPTPREATGDAWLKARSAGLIRDFVARSGYPGDEAVRALTAFYAPQVVSYGGKPVSRFALLQEKEKSLFDRWPSRKYTIRPNTLDARCDAAASTCSVTGVLDWDYATRYGSSSFSYVVSVQGEQAMIVKEDGSTLETHDRETAANGAR